MTAPRDYFEDPSEFGRDMRAWAIDRPKDRDAFMRWHAAKLHHAVAVTFRERIEDRGITRKAAAAQMGTSVDYLGRVLRGEVWLSATTLAGLELVAGDLVVVTRTPSYRTLRRVDRTVAGD